jgi:hypothetical protein
MGDQSVGPPDWQRIRAVQCRFGEDINRSSTLTTAFLMTFVISLLVTGSWATPIIHRPGVSSPQAVPLVTPALAPQTPVPSNATDCGLLSPYYIQGTVSALGWPPSCAKDIQVVFAKLCKDTAFVTLLSEWGGWHWTPAVTANGTTTPGSWAPSNFSVQLGGSGPPSAWGNWTYIGVVWISWEKIPANATVRGACRPCQWNDYWTGSLPGSNFTGPNLTIYQPISGGASSPPSSAGVAGLLSLLSNVWLVGLLGAVVLAVAISSLAVVRRRASRRPHKSGIPARAEGEVRSGTAPAVLGQPTGDASPTHAQQGTSPESSDSR